MILGCVVWLDVYLLIDEGLLRVVNGVSTTTNTQDATIGTIVLLLRKPIMAVANGLAFLLAVVVHVKAFGEQTRLRRL